MVVAGVVALALVLGGAVVVDTVRSRAQDDRLTVTRGGMLPLDTAPSRMWKVKATDGVASVGGALVTVVRGEVIGVDLDTGAELWRTDLGAPASCGPSSWRVEPQVSDGLVCVTEEPFRVVVLGDGGRVRSDRALDTADGPASPGPGIDLVRAVRTGEPGAAGEDLDVVVRLEDAISGEVRWEETTPFEPDSWACTTTEGGLTMVNSQPLQVYGGGGMIEVYGCGVGATFDVKGRRLDDPGTPEDRVWPALGGGFLRVVGSPDGTGVQESELLGPDGPVVRVPGEILDPMSADGDVDVWLVVEEGGTVRAVDRSGGALWTAEGLDRPDGVLTHAAGVVVVSSAQGTTGLDAATGRELWNQPDDGTYDVAGAMTDGDNVIIVRSPVDGAFGVTVEALDLGDGSTSWTLDDSPLEGYPLTVQGRLFLMDNSTVTRIG